MSRSKRSKSSRRVGSTSGGASNAVERGWSSRVTNYHTFAKKRKSEDGKYWKSKVSTAKRACHLRFRFAPDAFLSAICSITHNCFSGGPGSGKVTHCDTLMQEKRGVTHINMMDLLQQYAIGNGKFSATNRH